MTTLAFIGNVMLGRGVSAELRDRDPRFAWGSALPILQAADAVIANLECVVTTGTGKSPLKPKKSFLRFDRFAVDILRAGNVRCVSLANNHVLDFGEGGLLDTLDQLDAAGIAHAGAGRTLAQASAPAILRLPDITIGIVGLTDKGPAFAAACRASGTHYIDVEAAPPPGIGLAGLAQYCAEKNADLAILSLHWGPDGVVDPSPTLREFAHVAIRAGFDVIHGHSSHVFHGVEIHRQRPVLYDCGDFIHGSALHGRERNDWSFIVLIDIARKRIERVRMIPVRLRHGRVDVAEGVEAAAICGRMLERCAAIGTPVTSKNRTLEIGCAAVVEAEPVTAGV